ncbi:MAG: hypothetical protein HOB79_22185 [Rhodospirillaceae bacterium]|jgi:hypothetical protein|nr:hypothetical protein [Rhodospirillales bacterium]MBT3905834.1 hypothetical protein [Rhodospirillaceae bacterium]MBT4703791.1 hypothetical protein [Rhodospirillaceae bacterium]MBT5035136.1 hypothetical protein [Rhodospirillaceae bacterium]MBT6220257.1 hypothetical protein [Rhodospirillaceae bacterium]
MFSPLRYVALIAGAMTLSACAEKYSIWTFEHLDVDRAFDRAIKLYDDIGKGNSGNCVVDGHAFRGLRESSASSKNLKLLIVHGIGYHPQDYSKRLVLNLIHELGMKDKGEDTYKLNLKLKNEKSENGNDLPNQFRHGAPFLTIKNYRKADKNKSDPGPSSLTIFEVTWSPIIEEERKALLYDNEVKFGLKRAFINDKIKRFLNDRAIDPLIYARKDNVGSLGSKILDSVEQSLCWMTRGDWSDYRLTKKDSDRCEWDGKTLAPEKRTAADQVKTDEYAIVTFSLGSQIVIDALTEMAPRLSKEDKSKKPDLVKFYNELKRKSVAIYMLANQLPVLRIGYISKYKPITRSRGTYCNPNNTDKWLNELNIVAFSDPNDLLSYPIPENYSGQHIDSRFCSKLTNVVLNVAEETKYAAYLNWANPIDAHSNYDADARVIRLIVDGAKVAKSNKRLVLTRDIGLISDEKKKEDFKKSGSVCTTDGFIKNQNYR